MCEGTFLVVWSTLAGERDHYNAFRWGGADGSRGKAISDATAFYAHLLGRDGVHSASVVSVVAGLSTDYIGEVAQ